MVGAAGLGEDNKLIKGSGNTQGESEIQGRFSKLKRESQEESNANFVCFLGWGSQGLGWPWRVGLVSGPRHPLMLVVLCWGTFGICFNLESICCTVWPHALS